MRGTAMAKTLYFLVTFFESSLSIFGIRSGLEQPPYHVIATLAPGLEIRAYGPMTVVETQTDGNQGEAFSRLFSYITGANRGDTLIKMTAPVSQGNSRGDDRLDGGPFVMRFVLPKAVAGDPPVPTDTRVKVVAVPARTMAVLRFSGSFGRSAVEAQYVKLKEVLARTGHATAGAPYFLGYDPPFTIPALRRNEVALDLQADS